MKLSDLHAAYGLSIAIGHRSVAQRVDVYFPKDTFAVPVEIEAGPQKISGTLRIEKFTPDNPLEEWDMEITLSVPEVHELGLDAASESEPANTPEAPADSPAREEQESSFLASPKKAEMPTSTFTDDAIPYHDEVEEQEGESVYAEGERERLAAEEAQRAARTNGPLDAETLKPVESKAAAVKPAAAKTGTKKKS